jgi:hypothetical protein
VRGDVFYSRHSPLLHLTSVHMSKSTLHWSPSLNYFMVPVVGGGEGEEGVNSFRSLSRVNLHSASKLKISADLEPLT